MVRAKFKCLSITVTENNVETVSLTAANGPKDSANAQWSKWTPSGSLQMSITAEGAQGKFKPGKFYFLDFSEAAEDA